VVLWSDQTTSFAGTIFALGGKEIGNGGFVETSGKGLLNFTGNVDTRRVERKRGYAAADPADLYITKTLSHRHFGASQILVALSSHSLPTATSSLRRITPVSPAGNNGDIFITSGVVLNWTGSNSLTLSAYRNITFSDNVAITHSAGTGNLIARADSTGTGIGTIAFNQATFGSKVDFTGSNGKVSFYYKPDKITRRRRTSLLPFKALVEAC